MVSPGSRLSRIPPTFGGGIEAYEYNLSRKIVDLGSEAHILCRGFPDMPLEEKLDGVYIHRIKLSEKNERRSLVTFSLQAAKKLLGLISRKHDVVHCHERISGMGIFLFRIHKKAPIFFSEHNSDSLMASRQYFDNWLLYQVNLWADSYMIKHSTKVFAISEAMRQTIINRIKVPPEQVVATPNSIDVDRLKPRTPDPSLRKRFGIDDGPLLLFVGRLDPEKGINHLIKAMPHVQKEIPSVNLLICGEGKKENDVYGIHLRNLAHNLGDSVIFTGRIPFQEVVELYNLSDVFVLPSLFEVMPTVLLEAMAFAKPVVATDIPGTNEVVKDGETGLLTEPSNVKNLANALITLLKDERLAKRMGEKGREVVETFFSWDKNASVIIREYEKALLNKN